MASNYTTLLHLIWSFQGKFLSITAKHKSCFTVFFHWIGILHSGSQKQNVLWHLAKVLILPEQQQFYQWETNEIELWNWICWAFCQFLAPFLSYTLPWFLYDNSVLLDYKYTFQQLQYKFQLALCLIWNRQLWLFILLIWIYGIVVLPPIVFQHIWVYIQSLREKIKVKDKCTLLQTLKSTNSSFHNKHSS